MSLLIGKETPTPSKPHRRLPAPTCPTQLPPTMKNPEQFQSRRRFAVSPLHSVSSVVRQSPVYHHSKRAAIVVFLVLLGSKGS